MSKPKVEKVPSVEDRSLPIFDEFDKITERIRTRAYEFFKEHGFGDGRDLEDWLRAEREVCWPSAELAEDDKTFTLKVALAGFDADDITVTANPQELIVKATEETSAGSEGAEDAETKEQGPTVHWSEFRHENVYRHVTLPAEVDVGKIKAELKDGLLTIAAPKAAVKKPVEKTVEISTAA